jgi:hypothetical protein
VSSLALATRGFERMGDNLPRIGMEPGRATLKYTAAQWIWHGLSVVSPGSVAGVAAH